MQRRAEQRRPFHLANRRLAPIQHWRQNAHRPIPRPARHRKNSVLRSTWLYGDMAASSASRNRGQIQRLPQPSVPIADERRQARALPRQKQTQILRHRMDRDNPRTSRMTSATTATSSISNETQLLPIEQDDRRHFVIWTGRYRPAYRTCATINAGGIAACINTFSTSIWATSTNTIQAARTQAKRAPSTSAPATSALHQSLAGGTSPEICPCGSDPTSHIPAGAAKTACAIRAEQTSPIGDRCLPGWVKGPRRRLPFEGPRKTLRQRLSSQPGNSYARRQAALTTAKQTPRTDRMAHRLFSPSPTASPSNHERTPQRTGARAKALPIGQAHGRTGFPVRMRVHVQIPALALYMRV